MLGELRELYSIHPDQKDEFCRKTPELVREKLGSIGLIRVDHGNIEVGMELNIGGHRVAVFGVGTGDLVMEASQNIKSILCDLDVGLRAELVGGRGRGRWRDRIGAKVGTWRGGACEFIQLNDGWNADPNAPYPEIVIGEGIVELWVWPNRHLYPEFADNGRICVMFEGCEKFRMTAVNDHGWFDGQCRFSRDAPKWGEFYEITGDTRDEEERTPWVAPVKDGAQDAVRHFHFYLRDEAFECKAKGWRMKTHSFPETGEKDNV